MRFRLACWSGRVPYRCRHRHHCRLYGVVEIFRNILLFRQQCGQWTGEYSIHDLTIVLIILRFMDLMLFGYWA